MAKKSKTRKIRTTSKTKSAASSGQSIDVALHEIIRLLQVIGAVGIEATKKFETVARKRRLVVRVDPDTVSFVGAYIARNRLGKPTAKLAGAPAIATRAMASTASRPVGDRFKCF